MLFTNIGIDQIKSAIIIILILILVPAAGSFDAAYGAAPGKNDSHKGNINNPAGEDSEDETGETKISRPSIGFETDYISKYMWYGIALSEGAVAQSCLWLENRGYTYMIYGNLDLSKREFDQYNLYISKSLNIGGMDAEFALQSYHYPTLNDSPPTREFILTLTRPYKNFSLYLSQSWDIQTYKGSYVADLGISFEREMKRGDSFKSSLYIEYGSRIFNEVNLELAKPAIDMAGVEFSYTRTRKDGIYIRPHVEYCVAVDKELREIVEKTDTLSYGIAVGKNF